MLRTLVILASVAALVLMQPGAAAPTAVPLQGAAADDTCSYPVVVGTSASCPGGLIQYTCNANNCYVSGTCSVIAGTPVVGGLSCAAFPPPTMMVRGETILASAACNAVAVVAVSVTIECGWYSDT